MRASRFAAELKHCADLSACSARFMTEVAPFGFDSFACGEVDLRHRERTTFFAIHWPEEWQRFYLEAELVERDPVIEALRFRGEPFTWDDLRADRRMAALGREGLRRLDAHGWGNGLVVPIEVAAERKGLVSLAGRGAPPAAEQRAYLHLIALLLFQHTRARAAREGPVVAPAGLTRREMTAMRLVEQGRTDKQIGEALAISPTTAHEHVENAKRKLGVHSRAELAAIAVELLIAST
jgi:DNA-binding CsgD family transcriptional regulator